MSIPSKNRARCIASVVLGAIALATVLTVSGCSGAGQGEVTQSDRPSEGDGWAPQEQMADR